MMKVHCVQKFICFTRLYEPWLILSCVSSLLIFPGHGSHMGLVRGSLASRLFVTPSLASPALLTFVIPPLVCEESLSSSLLAGDNSWAGRISLSFCSWCW